MRTKTAAALKAGMVVRYSKPDTGENDLTFVVIELRGDRVLIESRDFPDARVKPTEVVATGDVVPVTIKEHAQALATKTADAYSWDNYGEKRWLDCCLMLLKRGFTEREAEAILRSKWTRWAGDMASDKGRTYGHVRASDLARFIDAQRHLKRDVADLVVGTFGSEL